MTRDRPSRPPNPERPDAPIPAIKAYAEKFEHEFKFKSSHDGMKGYIAMYTATPATEKAGKVDRGAFAQALHNACFGAKLTPGLLMDLCYDDKGDLDRESFLVEVKGGRQAVVAVLPPLQTR